MCKCHEGEDCDDDDNDNVDEKLDYTHLKLLKTRKQKTDFKTKDSLTKLAEYVLLENLRSRKIRNG